MSSLSSLSLAELQTLLSEHQAVRPAFDSHDFKPWLIRKDELKFWTELAQASAAIAWKDVPPPSQPPAPPPAESTEEPMANKKLSDLSPEQAEARRAYHREWKAKNKGNRKSRAKPISMRKGSKVTLSPEAAEEMAGGMAELEVVAVATAAPVKRTPNLREPSSAPLAPSAVAQVRQVRSRIWTLMAALEDMDEAQREALLPELGLLDAAAHSAHQLALGRLEVA